MQDLVARVDVVGGPPLNRSYGLCAHTVTHEFGLKRRLCQTVDGQ